MDGTYYALASVERQRYKKDTKNNSKNTYMEKTSKSLERFV
jgi:hypothetical protein